MSLPLPDLLDSWTIALRAQRKSKQTVDSYTQGVRQFIRFCAEQEIEASLDRRTLDAFTADLLDRGMEGATARSRHMAVRYFSAWLFDEEEIPRDELVGAKPPKLDEKIVEPLTVEEIKKLLAACAGKRFIDRRDEALIRFMLETTARSSEALDVKLSELDLKQGMAIIRRGKGGKGRSVPFSPQCGQTIDRYLRMRRRHRLADSDQLWLGGGGQTLSYSGMWKALNTRAQLAGIDDFHPHKTRHTAAWRWLMAGGSEGGLMAIAGWSRRDMLDRYTRSTAASRAMDEARGLNLGEL